MLNNFFIQKLFYLDYPQGYLWDFPGIYSLTVPYGKTNDFFFSGHVGACVICFCEYMAIGWTKLGYFSLFSLINQIALMIALRGHYVIDLIAGVVFGHYAWIMAERYSYLIDVKLFRMPFHRRFLTFNNSCSNCQHPIQLWCEAKVNSKKDK